MGGAESASALPFPAEWAEPKAHKAAIWALRTISAMKPGEFLAATAPIPELEATAWKFDSYLPYAATAVKMDMSLNKMVYIMVPKRASEEEFWRLYFCHARRVVVGAVRAAGVGDAVMLSYSLLQVADDNTSSAIIAAFKSNKMFVDFSKSETDAILKRDAEDDEKLSKGIEMAVAKGVIEANPEVEPVCTIDVMGMSADSVAGYILDRLGDEPSKGCVVVLQGLSGTGKGTTVAKLAAALPRSVCWSNGNLFRCLTLLALSHCEAEGLEFTTDVLTPQLLKQLLACLKFGKYGDEFDIKISGYGYDTVVSQIANTVLKEPRIGKNIPTVAKVTQGEVIEFAAGCAGAMRFHGMNVLMEGRAQTLNYVRTTHRFELTLADPQIIGMRRAAQRMIAPALRQLQGLQDPSCDAVLAALNEELSFIVRSEGSCAEASPALSKSLLQAADDATSSAVIAAFKSDDVFQDFSKRETEGILQRDQEDDDKLAAGIQMAVAKGVVPADPPVEPVCKIDVMGMSADAVAAKIIDQLGDAPSTGCVLVLQGLSGTGKGTTVAKLEAALPRAVCWSNGNVFRSLTLLSVSYCEKKGLPFTAEVLTPELLQECMSCLEFGKFDGKFDIHINGFGNDVFVSKVANTVLKDPRVGKNIPTVAKVTQGEVIKFAASAAEAMRADGMNVLMEGRAQTLNYVRTPHRFELMLADPNIIGMRRAAQRMVGGALERLSSVAVPSAGDIREALQMSLAAISLSKSLLQAGDDMTSNVVIGAFKGDATFRAFAKKETDAILERDKEDDEKLAAGIYMAVKKGVVPARPQVEPICKIDVMGMSADAVAAKIVERLGNAPSTGCVLVLQGLSGTGKGTTVAKLEAVLPRAVSWSNGNVFRSLTLLAVSYCEQKGQPFTGVEVLTPELLSELTRCLHFGKFDGKFDIHIDGFGHNTLVSKIANTVLKEQRVSKHIPTVAKVTQGEVISFAAGAAEAMRSDGMNVLMEGRAQTLNYVRTPHRFELTLADPSIIGMRRAAQRMAGRAVEQLASASEPSCTQVYEVLQKELMAMAKPTEEESSPFA